jgi:hypothetical protein
MRPWLTALLTIAAATCLGCGTTKWTDTSRTATEQLLISDSIDRAISRTDFRALAGKRVFVDDTPIKHTTDTAYLVSSLRQHILASGAILKEKRDDAEYILEVRAGAVGTDRHDLFFGIPAITLPAVGTGGVTQIPELPFYKKTEQRGVTKLYMFVYNRDTGRPIWQSGSVPEESRAKAVWLAGTGPFQRGTIYDGTKFAGDKFDIPLIDFDKSHDGEEKRVSVADEAFFIEPHEMPSMARENKLKSATTPSRASQPRATSSPSAANRNDNNSLGTSHQTSFSDDLANAVGLPSPPVWDANLENDVPSDGRMPGAPPGGGDVAARPGSGAMPSAPPSPSGGYEPWGSNQNPIHMEQTIQASGMTWPPKRSVVK